MTAGRGRRWSTVEDVTAALRRRWDRGELLRRLADRQGWEPIRVPLRGPGAREVAADFGAVQDWVTALRRAADGTDGHAGRPGHAAAGFRLETRRVGGRLVGANELPAAAWFDTPEQTWALLRTARDVAAYRQLLETAESADPALRDWVARHPMRALRHRADWELVVRTALWLRDRAGSGVYLRQVDVPGVDTKFIERRAGLLAELLEALGCPRREDGSGRGLEAAFGFLGRPERLRLRRLDGRGLLPGAPLTDVAVRVDELAELELSCHAVLVVENEVTFLALPPLPGVVAVFGAGFDVLRLARVPWLAGERVLYWGDVDTHGFVILDRLRASLPEVESVLMDRDTLLAHRSQWVTESAPSRERLGRLTQEEQEVYADLVGDVHGPAVRLEQERVNYAHAVTALHARVRTPSDQT